MVISKINNQLIINLKPVDRINKYSYLRTILNNQWDHYQGRSHLYGEILCLFNLFLIFHEKHPQKFKWIVAKNHKLSFL